jgi:hypothetical protein
LIDKIFQRLNAKTQRCKGAKKGKALNVKRPHQPEKLDAKRGSRWKITKQSGQDFPLKVLLCALASLRCSF